jgi:hypothetical protein
MYLSTIIILTNEGKRIHDSLDSYLYLDFLSMLCGQSHDLIFLHNGKPCFRIIGALSLMSTLFIGVAIMAKIDSDKWQGGRYVIVIIT